MELQALLVLGGVAVAGIAVLLLMSLFSSSGTSYEEAIAQQRKAATELLALADSKNKNNKKSNKKAIKKQAKKEKKESVAASTGSDHESEAPAESGVEDEASAPKVHVEFSPPVVVDVPRDTVPNVKIRKRGKDPKVKPILVNKEDPSCVSDPAAARAPNAILNHFDEIHPKDEFELLQSSLAADKSQEKVEEPEKKEAKAPKAAKTKSAAKPAPPVEAVKEDTRERRDSAEPPKEQRKAKEVPERAVPPLNAPQPSEMTTAKLLKPVVAAPATAAPAPAPAAATPPSSKKKKKPEPNNAYDFIADGVNVAHLERLIRSASLSETELQTLTNALLDKQHYPLPRHSEWTEGPNDPMQKLKKQLAEKEKALEEKNEDCVSLQAKLKELKAKLDATQSQLPEAAAAQAAARAELHTLQTRLARLLEDNHALAQEKILMQQKLAAEGDLEAQRVQMEMHIQRLSEAEMALLQQIAALQAECNAHAIEAKAAHDSCIVANQHVTEMAQQLQEMNRAYSELEQQRQLAVSAEQRAQQEARAAQDRLAAMAELQNEVQRLSSRAQAAEASADKVMEEAEKQKQQLSSEISALTEQLAAREAELAEVKQLKAAPAQNGLPAQEQHKVAELAAVERVVDSLRGELEAAQLASREQRAQLEQLTAQLDTYRDKNNELRTKNWKVMEALQSAERALQTRASALPARDLREAITKAQEAQYSEAASVLRAACPAAAPAAAAGRDWLRAFADNLKKELHKLDAEKQELLNRTPEKVVVEKVVERLVEQPAAARPDARGAALQQQNTQLQADLDKYKLIIDQTETVLSRLQNRVSSEEARWESQLAAAAAEGEQARAAAASLTETVNRVRAEATTEKTRFERLLQDKQAELDQLRATTLHQEPMAFAYSCIERSLPAIIEEMQNKIEALESQLETKATNHHHTFADAERLAEERALGGLSEKHSLDVRNGPSQVGLEEK